MASATNLNPTQVVLLQTLDQHGQLTRTELEALSGVTASIDNLGPVYASENHHDSLRGQGLVRVLEQEDDGPPIWEATGKGSKLAKVLCTKLPTPDEQKIPHEILDKAVLRIKPLRTYGFESYTEDDIIEILAHCGEAYCSVPVDAVRQQIANRRKVGAYADKEKQRKADFKKLRKLLATYELELTKASVERLDSLDK